MTLILLVNMLAWHDKKMFTHLRLQLESLSTLLSCFFEFPILFFVRSSSFKKCNAFVLAKGWAKQATSVMPQSLRLEKDRGRDFHFNPEFKITAIIVTFVQQNFTSEINYLNGNLICWVPQDFPRIISNLV